MQSSSFVYALMDDCQLCLQLNVGCSIVEWLIVVPEQQLLIQGAQYQCCVAVLQAVLCVV